MGYLVTTEYVSSGHPDKIADQISDAILDEFLNKDSQSKVACETLVKNNCVVLAGEVTSKSAIDFNKIVRETVNKIGYNDETLGFNSNTLTIINLMGKQSPEINYAVEGDSIIKAGDQGFMIGYATNETETFMPLGHWLSRKIVELVLKLGYGPDAKSQVTLEYDKDNNISSIHTILVSVQHPYSSLVEMTEKVREGIISFVKSTNNSKFLTDRTNILINPAGSWFMGGPVSDCGLTGRKVVVDQYGPYCPIGGGAFSGKDPSKVDRSGAYLARYIAKNIVAAGISSKCKVEISYIIGQSEPASIRIDTFGTINKNSIEYSNNWYVDEMLVDVVKKHFPLTPQEIIDKFGLCTPIYYRTAREGHFGHNMIEENGLKYWPWEELDKVSVFDIYKKQNKRLNYEKNS